MNTVLEKILKSTKDHRGVSHKDLAVLPISSLAEMDNFENIEENSYTEVVSKKKKNIFLALFFSLSI